MLSSPKNPSWVTDGFVIPQEVVEERLQVRRREEPHLPLAAKDVVRRLDLPLNEADFGKLQRIAGDARYFVTRSLVVVSPDRGTVMVSRDPFEYSNSRHQKAFLSPGAPSCTIFIPEEN